MNSARTIRIVVDASAAKRGAAEANAALASIGSGAKGATGPLNSATNAVNQFGRSSGVAGQAVKAANDNIVKSNNSILNMARSLGRATIALAGLTALTGGVTALAMALTGASDKAGQIEARLRNATKSTQAFAAANADVVRIANQTRNDLLAVTTLYSKMSKNADTLKLSTAGVGLATQSFAMALKVGGATAQEAEASILQLGQAMGSGVLNGDEFKSLSENADVFIKMLAKSMDVPQAALKKLGAEGKITGEQIAKALTDPKIVADIEAQFGRIPVSFADVRTAMGNTMIQIAGALKEGLGIDQSLAVMVAQIQDFGTKSKPIFIQLGQQIRQVFDTLAPIFKAAFAVVGPAIGLVAQNMGTIVKLAVAVGAGFIAMKASMGLSGVIAQVSALGIRLGATGGFAAFAGGAMGVFSAGVRIATGAVNTFTVALLANPVTALAVALTGTIALLYQFRDSIKIGTGEFGTLGDMFREIFSMIGPGLKALADIAGKVFSGIAGFVNKHFGWIGNFVKKIFGDINFSLFGWMKASATVIDAVAAYYINCFKSISNVWGALPQIMGAIVTSAANFVITGIENMVQRAINGINGLISMANNIPLVDIQTLGDVKFGRVNGPSMPQGLIDTSSRGIGLRAGVDAFGQRVEARGKTRSAAAAAGPAANDNAVNANASTLSSDTKKDKDAADAAKKRAEAIKEYWQGLEQSRDAAGLLGFELDRHNAILEYRKILGDGDLANARALTEAETTRITNLLQETATRKALGDLNQTNADLTRANNLLTEEGALLGTMSVDRVREEMGIRTQMGDLRARLARENVNMSNAELDAAVALHEALLRQNVERARANNLLAERQREGARLLEGYERARDPAAYAARQRQERDTAIRATVARDGETPEQLAARIRAGLEDSAREFSDDLKDISKQFHDRMSGAINQIADAIGGQWGDAIAKVGQAFAAMAAQSRGDNKQGGIIGGIADMLSGPANDRTAFGKAFESTSENFMKGFSDLKGSMTSSFSSFKSMFSKNGSFMSNMGSVMGNAGMGGAIGSAIGGIGKMINKRFNETGSSVGGMIGGAVGGPLGSVIGSVAGGVIGGIFSKPKVSSGKAGITFDPVSGTLTVASSGKHGGEAAAAQMAEKVVSSITSIAQRLGATIGGNPNVAVGVNGGDFRVSPTGGGVTGKQGINFKTEAEAIAFAIKDLIADGVLVGLSDFSNRLLRGAKNIDSVVGLAEQWEKMLKDLKSIKDPLGSAVSDLTTNLDRMVKQMIAAGATSSELAKVEEYRRLKLDQMLKDQLSGLNDFRKTLFGEGSGVSALNRLMAAQNEFAKYQATIASGGNIDQNEFTRIGQEVFDLARSVYGTSSSQFQAIRQALIAATDGAITNVTKAFDDATVVAINQQTDAITQNQAITNDLLRQILAAQGGGATGFGEGNGRVVNGRYIAAVA